MKSVELELKAENEYSIKILFASVTGKAKVNLNIIFFIQNNLNHRLHISSILPMSFCKNATRKV
jgi:hypothetical protein